MIDNHDFSKNIVSAIILRVSFVLASGLPLGLQKVC